MASETILANTAGTCQTGIAKAKFSVTERENILILFPSLKVVLFLQFLKPLKGNTKSNAKVYSRARSSVPPRLY